MLPSSSSQFTRYGQISHLKKFWLLQTQLEKQEQNSSTAATLSLGTPAIASVKDGKPLVSSTSLATNADHHLMNGSSIAGHGSCRVEMAACSGSSIRPGAFPYTCSNDQAASLRYHTSSHAGLPHASSRSSNIRGSPTLSLAVNCGSVAYSADFLNQTCSTSSLLLTSDLELRLHHTPHLQSPLVQACFPNQVQNALQAHDEEVVEMGESSNGCPPPSIVSSSGHEAALLSSSGRSSHGVVTPLRTCTVCGTTKTPLWRGGPNGPKSLCNACGIRMKKTKRLQAAMETAGGDGDVATSRGATTSAPAAAAGAHKGLLMETTKDAAAPSLKRKLSMEAAEDTMSMMEKRKKKKMRSSGPRTPCAAGEAFRGSCLEGGVVEESSQTSSNLLAQDVEEAAVLLMALSCGLVLS